MIDIFILNITELTKNDYFFKCYNRLSQERKKSIDKCKTQNAKLLKLGAGTLLDYGLRKHNLRENEVEFYYNKFGKPYLKNNNSIYFNISHSGKYVICVFSNLEIGVDIQEVLPVKFNYIKNFLPKSCITHIFNQNGSNKQIFEFYRIWTMYESYIKMLGKNLTYPFFDINLESIINSHLLKVDDNVFNFHELNFKDNHYFISICSPDSYLNEIVCLNSHLDKYLHI